MSPLVSSQNHPLRQALAAALVAIFYSLAGSASAQSPSYEQGVDAFNKRDFVTAREAFLKVVNDERQVSSDLFFNLGNAFYRLDQPGEAALWYRRALLLDPTDAAASQNLRVVRRRTGFLEFEPDALEWLASLMKHRHWEIFLAAAAWSAAVFLAGIIFLQPPRRTRAWWWSGFVFALGFTGLALAGTLGRLSHEEIRRRAVVTQSGSTALTGPTETAAVVIDLPPGSELLRHEARDQWTYVTIPGENVGWIHASTLQPLWPFDLHLLK